MSIRPQGPRRNQQRGVAIHYTAPRRDQDGAVRIAIKCNPGVGPRLQHPLAQMFHMQSPAIEVDVAPVRLIEHGSYFSPRFAKQIRCKRRRRTVAAIQHDAHSTQPNRQCGKQKVEIRPGCKTRLQTRGRGVRLHSRQNAENFFFDFMLFRIRQLIAGSRENLDAVVLKRIVRCRDHHARGKAPGARQPRDSRRCHHTRKLRPNPGAFQPPGKLRRDRRTRFARVHPDEYGRTG